MTVTISDQAFKGGAAVTLAYVALFHVLFFVQSKMKMLKRKEYKKKGEKFSSYYNSADKDVLMMDRTVGNFREQTLPFLATFWLALAARGESDCRTVIYRGFAYVVFRALYPVLWGASGQLMGGITALIRVSTVPSYLINFSFMYEIVRAIGAK
ncbi:hypothetical protein JKP88DRAFT_301103 [Tribonema minus]|uniref:Uncharacterized protein n=1 Tax=Tribonema minus TaxID=303371 RepID=A0A835ZE67_9STRA|nr:hypothetical protein JKP88DRAFT_301103 [Tribonema minus]